MSLLDAARQMTKAATRLAITPVVAASDLPRVVCGEEPKTPKHLKQIVRDVEEIPDAIDD
ncbi:MAG: hypothetical protein AAF333_13170 [Planctomycetota bacterium]